MRSHRLDSKLRATALLVASLPITGCTGPHPEEGLRISLDVSDTRLGPDAPITLTITATNKGDEVFAWGEGSSSCQLSAVVLIDTDQFPIDLRMCTMDLVPQELAAGETRTESWVWHGEFLVQGALDTLPHGEYRIQATAGSAAQSNLRTIRVDSARGSSVSPGGH